MMEEHLLDMEGGFGEMWTTSLRCMNCGHVHDSVIEQHRVARQEQVVALASGKPDMLSIGARPVFRETALLRLSWRE